MNSIYDERYRALVNLLRETRDSADITQEELARRLNKEQPFVSKVENCERRVDIIELLDWLGALDYEPQRFFKELGWFALEEGDTSGTAIIEKIPALPIPGGVEIARSGTGILQHLDWQGKLFKVLLEGLSEQEYLDVEYQITEIFSAIAAGIPVELDGKPRRLKNREAICLALQIAVAALPDLNPSDIYQHLVYRLFVRQTRSPQSWVRSGGEAVELFIERHYAPILETQGIRISALFSGAKKREALEQMGLVGVVGNSKLDVVLHGWHDGQWCIFGAVHSKASLAERVTDDEPASKAMMERGLASYLWTFDSKSYPPPGGNLVNYGELGTPENPSDKREYVEAHGSFSACYSYNTRGRPSTPPTPSGRLIYVSSLKRSDDPFPSHVASAWTDFVSRLSTRSK